MSEKSRVVVSIARSAIEQALGLRADLARPDTGWLHEHGASFVTLKWDGDLRGCIGSLEAYRALAEDIAGNAVAAALHDRRFPPVRAGELEFLDIEVSILTPAEPLACTSEADALMKLRAGIDGVIIEYGHQRATFLPQVWENLPGVRSFLRELKRKAGLPGDFWHADLRVQRYGVEKHCERETVE